MVHRAIFGSLERFFGVLIENTAGDFPLWIAPTQLRLLPVIDGVLDYCYEVKKAAEKVGLRVEIDTRYVQLARCSQASSQQLIFICSARSFFIAVVRGLRSRLGTVK